jgi:Arc/MetJ-type ribon-helix-helix transcriptional regulator
MMARSTVAISLDESTLNRLDQLVKKRVFPNRSRAIEEAVAEKLARLEKSRLALECAKLDPMLEKALAEEGLSADLRNGPNTEGRNPLGRLKPGTDARTSRTTSSFNVSFGEWEKIPRL